MVLNARDRIIKIKTAKYGPRDYSSSADVIPV